VEPGRALRTLLAAAILGAGFAPAGPASAQLVLEGTEQLEDDRPELWGLEFAAAVTEFASLGAPEPLAPGGVEAAFEAGSIPSLSEEERRIGFEGTKVEEIDRGPAYGRLRARIGLPAGFELGLGLVPPVELDGLEPLLYSASLGRTLLERSRLRVGAALVLHGGRLEGDITCDRDAVAAGDDPERNPLRCEEVSEDRAEIRTLGLAFEASWRAARPGRVAPYLRLAAHHVDGRFEVRARYDGIVDRTVLEGDDRIYSGALGAELGIGPAWRLAGEAAYTPLELRRLDGPLEEQSVLNFRLLFARRLR
jgi:hypothetical protein